MKIVLVAASAIALAASLTACQKTTNAPAPPPSSSTMTSDMANMPMASTIKHGIATGTVTAIQPAKGTVTLDHGPMSGIDWPAMKMAFSVSPAQLTDIAVGDKVDFEIDWDGKAGTITKIGKVN